MKDDHRLRRPFEIRPATSADVDAIADAHRDSIDSIGPSFYSPQAVEAWKQGVAAALYLEAMAHGEVFFIATGKLDGDAVVLGFSSDYPIEGTTHGTSVYVRGLAARQGLGTALIRTAEANAAGRGAKTIQIEASLAGREFYLANGYVEVGRGRAHLTSGHFIDCVLMRKSLSG
jgi:GNAT superfamily N-acetyltransferase